MIGLLLSIQVHVDQGAVAGESQRRGYRDACSFAVVVCVRCGGAMMMDDEEKQWEASQASTLCLCDSSPCLCLLDNSTTY